MEAVTYDLRNHHGNSNGFYLEVSSFSAEVLRHLEENAGRILSDYRDYLLQSGEQKRSFGEYGIELITLGMIWERYSGIAQSTPRAVVSMLRCLNELRSSQRFLKSPADRVKAMLMGCFIVPGIRKVCGQEHISMQHFERLLFWLRGTGEFKDEVKRLNNWHAMFKTEDREYFERTLRLSLELVQWFKTKAAEKLGGYTLQLERFLKDTYPKYRWREDSVFCGKEPLEYHLNMVASEIMNRGLAGQFKKTRHKVVLAPACMRSSPEKNCKCRRNGLDAACRMCSDECSIGSLARLGKEKGFEVYIIPHSSSFTKWLLRWQDRRETGVIAVACVLNIAAGGYEMRELSIPSQCVLLDYCGCKNHWHASGIATDLNRERILEILSR